MLYYPERNWLLVVESVTSRGPVNGKRHAELARHLPKKIDLRPLRRHGTFAFYFRYPLHHDDFREIRIKQRLRGYFAAKPLYGKLTSGGRVDRTAAFSGEVAAIFIPSPARSLNHAQLVLTRMPAAQVVLPGGGRNWPAIHEAAERTIREMLA